MCAGWRCRERGCGSFWLVQSSLTSCEYHLRNLKGLEHMPFSVFSLQSPVALKPGLFHSIALKNTIWAYKLPVSFFFDNWGLLKGGPKCLLDVGVSPVSMQCIEKVLAKCGLNKGWAARINWFRFRWRGGGGGVATCPMLLAYVAVNYRHSIKTVEYLIMSL